MKGDEGSSADPAKGRWVVKLPEDQAPSLRRSAFSFGNFPPKRNGHWGLSLGPLVGVRV